MKVHKRATIVAVIGLLLHYFTRTEQRFDWPNTSEMGALYIQ